MATPNPPSFLERHEFLIRRLHSLSGLIPVGAYMVVHLLTNASILNGPGTFQTAVYAIHSLGKALPIVEWVFIFLPLIFHAVLGVAIIRGGLPNNSSYGYSGNLRYLLQRATGMIAFVFIFFHVFHLHGWFHSEWWLENVAYAWGGAQFAPYNAPSTAAKALQQSVWVNLLYLIGVISCVFHLANGIWTMGITWGVWTSPHAQQRANWACGAFGVLLTIVGLSAWGGFTFTSEEQVKEFRKVEDQMWQAKTTSGEVDPKMGEEKRADHKPHAQEKPSNDVATRLPSETAAPTAPETASPETASPDAASPDAASPDATSP